MTRTKLKTLSTIFYFLNKFVRIFETLRAPKLKPTKILRFIEVNECETRLELDQIFNRLNKYTTKKLENTSTLKTLVESIFGKPNNQQK